MTPLATLANYAAKHIGFSVTDRVATIVLNRPEKKNPLTFESYAELVDIFRTMRQINLAVWKRMSPADLKRTGHHNERGPESLAVLLPMLAGHDLSHLDQITRYIQAVRQRA